MRLQVSVEPELVAGRDDPDGRHRVPAIDDSRHVAPINGFRDCSPEICGSKPCFFISRYRCSWNLVEPELFRVSGSAGITNGSAIGRKLFKDRRCNSVDQMTFTALVPHGFNLRVLFDIQPD